MARYVVNSRSRFARNIILVENNQFRRSQLRQAWERQAVKKLSQGEDIRIPIGEKFHTADSQEAFLSLFTD
tara:strand:+ start:3601 stop:3813 length:213 start_codon:yes stop_codon:yes gene_type:complete